MIHPPVRMHHPTHKLFVGCFKKRFIKLTVLSLSVTEVHKQERESGRWPGSLFITSHAHRSEFSPIRTASMPSKLNAPVTS
jgi:hypothetical protein